MQKRKTIFLIITIFILLLSNRIFSRDFSSLNEFDTFLLLNKQFKVVNHLSFNYEKNFNEILKNKNLTSLSSQSLKFKINNLKLNFSKIEKENINLDFSHKEFADFSSFSLNYKQILKNNISASFSYFYRKYSNFKFLDTDFQEKGYTINFSKYIKSNLFTISYENIDLSSSKPFEDFYISDKDKNKLTLSYYLNFSKRFSVIFMYSLSKFDKIITNENREDFFYTGIKYKFDFFRSLK